MYCQNLEKLTQIAQQYHSKYSDQYSKIVYESMGGKGDDDYEKEEKIIKKIVQNVVIEK